MMQDLSQRVVNALQTSGFLLVTSPFLPLDLQQSAIRVTREIFSANTAAAATARVADSDQGGFIDHPTDPKQYLMVDCHSRESILQDIMSAATSISADDAAATTSEHIKILSEYVEALETLKMQLLECIAIGLHLPFKNYLVDLHQTRNSVLRLLHYHNVTKEDKRRCIDDNQNKEKEDANNNDDNRQHTLTPASAVKIRCKAHSDYGSLTLLLTDGVPGLQAFVNGQWIPVPHREGALVVNIGSLLSEWTNGVLLATLHRVVLLENNESGQDALSSKTPSDTTRTSLAFFADPDPNVSTTLKETERGSSDTAASMSVSEYIQYRSGGASSVREGVQFTAQEQGRLKSSCITTADHNNASASGRQDEDVDPEELTLLWKGAMEIFIHQLLYVRKIYPHDTFVLTRFLETHCHACRHPGVVSYIDEALEMVVSTLLDTDNDCDELVVQIYNQEDLTLYEEYYLSFDSDTRTVAPIANVEKDLRDLICSVGSIGHVASSRWPDSVSFKVLLHCGGQTGNVPNKLDKRWYRAYQKKDRVDERRRIIYDVPSCGCTFQFQIHPKDIGMDIDD